MDFDTLTYDPDLGCHCWVGGEPFTGVCYTRWRGGGLESVAHFAGGLAEGMSVAWRYDGRIELYRDVADGLEVLWDEAGGVRSRGWFVRGQRQKAEPVPPAEDGAP